MPEKDVPEKKTKATDEDLDAMEGEGSPSAARRYEAELEQFKKEKNVEELAEEAARLLDEDPDATREAEEIGRSKKQEPGSDPEKKAA
jgi:hypothetical protein